MKSSIFCPCRSKQPTFRLAAKPSRICVLHLRRLWFYVQIYARIISWVLLLGENYSCHFWLPIIFHFTFLILFLYSVLKVRTRRPPTSRFRSCSSHSLLAALASASRWSLYTLTKCWLTFRLAGGGLKWTRTIDLTLIRRAL